MQCPFCGQDNDKVIDSRSSEGGRVVRRRRHCQACQRRFTTYERAEETIRLSVVKKDGSREPYSREKIIEGLEKACYKRPLSTKQLQAVLESAEETIFKAFEKDVPSGYIGDVVAERLREIDKIAYVRFASVYRDFADVGDLINEAQEVRHDLVIGPEQKDLFGEE
ncbi:MAG: transcriptional repressor NrdR [Planctomycetes bacterium]|nr:transcriptional regulator NrdR [Phycisphaerae bacterium]NBB95821.1 transcriptional repressor NrdR [Planctomycetota bacterium]